jgi:FHA domain
MGAAMIVEILDRHSRVRARHRVAVAQPDGHATVGRSAACDVVLDDPFVAAVHARITVDAEGRVAVTDLQSLNGIEVEGRRLHGVTDVRLHDGVFRVGRTLLRVRTAREAVAPEQVDGGPARPARLGEEKLLAAGFAVTIAAIVFDVWTDTARPRELSTALVTMLLATLALAGLWIALWALASRVAFGESRWLRHATILFVAYAVLSVVDHAIGIANGALGLHLSPTLVAYGLIGVAASAALAGHLVNASSMRGALAVAIGVTIPVVVVAALLWVQVRSEARSPNHIDDHDAVLPPALVLRRGVAFDAFTSELAELRTRADVKRAFVEREDPSPGEDDD